MWCNLVSGRSTCICICAAPTRLFGCVKGMVGTHAVNDGSVLPKHTVNDNGEVLKQRACCEEAVPQQEL